MKKRTLSILLLFALPGFGDAIATDYSVTNALDFGAGSLRQAIIDLNSGGAAGANTITVTASGAINLSTALPQLVKPAAFLLPNGPMLIRQTVAASPCWLLGSTAQLRLPANLSLAVQGSSLSRGIYSTGNLTLDGPVNSAITVISSSGASAHGIRADGDVDINGDLGGTIQSTAAAGNAWGVSTLVSGKNITINGDVTGSITTSAATVQSFGIGTVNGAITVTGGFWPASSIHVAAGTSYASALSAQYGGIVINGELGGDHCAEAQYYARTFYAYNDSPSATNRGLSIYGAVTGTLHAYSYGFNNPLDPDEIATVLVARYADVLLDKGITASASVNAEAADSGAYAVYAYYGNLLINGDIAGSVTATAGHERAYGLSADELLMHGAITGTITASAQGSVAAGIENGPDGIRGTTVSGGVSSTGQVLAASGTHSAAGFLSQSGGICGADSNSPLLVAGRVSAEASGVAAAILSVGPMNLLVTGSLTGVDRSGLGLGYAIRSGSFDFAGAFTDSIVATDLVTVAPSGTLAGKVDLGRGDDSFTLEGAANVTDVPLLAGGDGGETPGGGDRLLFSGRNGLYTESFRGWELIDVNDQSTIDLGISKTIAASPGLKVTMTIEAGSTVYSTRSSLLPGRYVIDGTLINGGLLDLQDGAADDRVTLSSTYTGSGGRIGLDAALASGGQTDPEQLDLLVVGSPGGTAGIAGGHTTLLIRNISLDGAIRPTTGKGILVVQVNGESSSDAFWLDSSNDFRGAEVRLLQKGGDGSGGESWYLVIPKGRPPFSDEVIRHLGPMMAGLGEELIPRFHERQAYGWSVPGVIQKEPASWWTRTTGCRFLGRVERGGESTERKGYSGTMQVGSDLYSSWQGNLGSRSGRYVGTGYMQADSRDEGGLKAGSAQLQSLSFGGYAEVECRGQWYLEGILQANRYAFDLDFARSGTSSCSKTWGSLASVEAGFRHTVSSAFYLEPQAQCIAQYIDGYSIDSPAGTVCPHALKSLLGRIGMTGTLKPANWSFSPFFEVNLQKEFGQSSVVTYQMIGESYRAEADRTKLGGAFGLSSRSIEPLALEYYLKAGVMAGLEGHGSRDYLLTLGLRKSW
ncbi:MAG: autotransporter domain-containing protein [Chlorobiaceae bacterium]